MVNINSSGYNSGLSIFNNNYPAFGFNVNVTGVGQTVFWGNTGNNHKLTLTNYGAGVYDLVVPDGSVGIGTATPTHTLNVVGNANITGNLSVGRFVNVSAGGDVCIMGGNCLSSVSGGSGIANDTIANLTSIYVTRNITIANTANISVGYGRIYWDTANSRLVIKVN
jgi:hypothetical protein